MHAFVGIYDVRGRLVDVLLEGTRGPGRHSVTWDGRDIGGGTAASGVYFCRLRTRLGSETTKLVLAR
jgi:flagellar hook assembly protein FlgD